MNQASHTAPICEKHGCEKVWHKNKARKDGGQWACKECTRLKALRLRRVKGAKPPIPIAPKTGPAPKCKKHGCDQVWRDNPRKAAGYQWECIECRREYDRCRSKKPERQEQQRVCNRRLYAANPQPTLDRQRRDRKADPKKFADRQRRWVANNPGKQRALCRRWAQANRDKVAASNLRWKRKDPERAIARDQRRRALEKNAIDPDRPVTVEVQKERKALFGGCCFCGSQEKLTLEHVIPLSKGGLHVPENLLGSCKSCNCKKHVTLVEEWYREQPFFSEERWSAIKRCTDLDCA